MMLKPTHDSLILVTGAAGAIGRNLTAMLLAKPNFDQLLTQATEKT
jgi:nucleoside-diphosphate-sugar epimerase